MYSFPVKIINCGHSICTPDWSTSLEMTVPFFRVYYVSSGKGEVIMRKTRYELQPGNIYFIPGNIPFINNCDKRMDVYWLHALPMSYSMESAIGYIKKVHSWKKSSLKIYIKAFSSIAQYDMASDSPPELFKLQSLVFLLLSLLLEESHRKKDTTISPSIRKAVQYMDLSFLENPSLKKISARASLAPNYFHRLFKTYAGTTPHSYMERKRMSLAFKLLTEEEKTVYETAQETGYENVFYFSRVFKKYFGFPPGKAKKIKYGP